METQEKRKKNFVNLWLFVFVTLIIISIILFFFIQDKSEDKPMKSPEIEKSHSENKKVKSADLSKAGPQTPEEKDYQNACLENNLSTYHKYLSDYPSGIYVKDVETQIRKLKEMPEQVRKIAEERSKGIKVEKNERGIWEADFGEGLVMIYIPPGVFIMGSDVDEIDEKPSHKLDLEGYWIGKYEVTFDQFDKFCTETQREKPDDAGWGRGNFPVISVSWEDAQEYCKWISSKTGFQFTLPTEAQWEKAARGTDGRRFPWGNQMADKNLANAEKLGKPGRTVPIGSYPLGASPYGLMDMAGNVWEWCCDWYDWYKVENAKKIEYPMDARSLNFRSIRGGSWFDEPRFVTTTNRFGTKPSYRGYTVGFRLCMGY